MILPWVLITLVTPLHWPGSANAAASVCLYSEQERSLTCRPIVRPRLTAGLWSPVRGGQSAIASRRRVPSLRFDMCATALETRPLPAISRAHPPATLTDYPAASNGGVRRFPGPPSGGRSAIALPPAAPWPFCDVSGTPPPAMSIDRRGCHIGREQHRGLARDRPTPFAPHRQSNSDHAGKRWVLGRNRES